MAARKAVIFALNGPGRVRERGVSPFAGIMVAASVRITYNTSDNGLITRDFTGEAAESIRYSAHRPARRLSRSLGQREHRQYYHQRGARAGSAGGSYRHAAMRPATRASFARA
jgi:hypothetical protein